MEHRARVALQDAGVSSEVWSGLAAVTSRAGAGNSCELIFADSTKLQEAKLLVRNLARVCCGDRPVWLDAGKTRTELRAARVIHRVHEVVAEIEAAKADPGVVVKHLNGKFVTVGQTKACYTLQGKVRWTPWAVTRYTSEERDWATAYAEEF